MIIVSACLAGVNCKGDGKSSPFQLAIELVGSEEAIPVCPEQLGGLPTPRAPAEKKGDRVFTKDGKDVTEEFDKGAAEALKIAQLANCKKAILKSKSPMCGSGEIYDGTFSGKLTVGNGIFAGLLKKNGIKVMTEEDL